MRNKMRKTIFRIKWMVMSENGKYAYLWARTEQHL